MRFVKVVIENFQAIERASIELGPGLNVLFGANDLGKSTIACAIRAALLVPPGSSEASRYSTWFADAVPEVRLTFVDDENRFWRVKKCFGATGAQRSAELSHSKDGVTFTRDSDGREVDEKLRELLGWGIPSPGGKGAPRGLPTSFLAHVLLAEQTDVETILSQSTEGDALASGRDRLRTALAALAEDPRFKRVLTEAQKNVDTFFTATGQRKRGRTSPFALAADELNRRAERIDQLKIEVASARGVEEQIRRLQDECSQARAAWEEAKSELATTRAAHQRSLDRLQAEQRLAAAKAETEALDARAEQVAACERGVEGLQSAVKAAEAALATAVAEAESSEASLRGAEEAHRAAASEDGAQQRELARAKLGEERAELLAQKGRAEKRWDDVAAAQQAADVARASSKANDEAKRALERAKVTEDNATREAGEAQQQLELARAVIAYGRWHAADTAARNATELTKHAQAAREECARKEAFAQDCAARAAEAETQVAARRARIPDAALIKRLEDLAQKISIAEAALGGGFTLALRGTGKVPVHVAIDGTDAVAGTAIDGRLVLDAERTAIVRIDDLLDFEIVAGAAEKRRALESLRERWTNEAVPLLAQAGVKTVGEVAAEAAEVAALDATAAKLRSEAKQACTEAESASQSAAMLDTRAGDLREQSVEIDDLKSKLEGHDTNAVAAHFSKLGASWKNQAEQQLAKREQALEAARESAGKARSARELAEYQSGQAREEAATAAAAAEAARAAAGLALATADVDPLPRELAAARAAIDALAAKYDAIGEALTALDREASNAVAAAKAAVDDAKQRRDDATARRQESQTALDDARSAFHTRRGEIETLRKELESIDRSAADARVVEAQSALAAYKDDPVVTSEHVAAAERREAETKTKHDQVRQDLTHEEGALSKVGGLGVHEDLARNEDAYAIAKEQQRQLEIDADAWKLLRDTLEVVEKEGSTHLGRSLAAPVSARLVELTQGRYSAIRFDQHLKAETVDVPSVTPDQNVLDALSAGTRDQIATLLRLTIAEQLKAAIVLDDHLVHTDANRLAWFRETLRKAALTTQVIVLTCRPHDYVLAEDLPDGPHRDVAGGLVRAVDVAKVLQRFGGTVPAAESAAVLSAAARE